MWQIANSKLQSSMYYTKLRFDTEVRVQCNKYCHIKYKCCIFPLVALFIEPCILCPKMKYWKTKSFNWLRRTCHRNGVRGEQRTATNEAENTRTHDCRLSNSHFFISLSFTNSFTSVSKALEVWYWRSFELVRPWPYGSLYIYNFKLSEWADTGWQRARQIKASWHGEWM